MKRNIEVQVTGDTSGAAKVDAALKGLKNESTAGAGAQSELGAASEVAGDKMGQAAEQAEKAHISHRGLHQVSRLLAKDFPIVGEVMHAAMFGVVGVVLLLVEGFRKLNEATEEWKKKAEAAATRAQETLEEFRVKTEKVVTDGILEWDSYERALKKASEGPDAITERFKVMKEAADAAFSASEKIANLNKELALQAAEHIQDPAARDAAKLKIEKDAIDKKFSDEEAKRAADLAAKKQELEAKTTEAYARDVDAKDKLAKRSGVDLQLETAQNNAKNYAQQKVDAEKATIEARRKLDEAERETLQIGQGTSGAEVARQVEARKRRIDSAKSSLAAAEKEEQDLPTRQKDESDRAVHMQRTQKEAQADYEEAKAKSDAAAKRVADLAAEVQAAQKNNPALSQQNKAQRDAAIREKDLSSPEGQRFLDEQEEMRIHREGEAAKKTLKSGVRLTDAQKRDLTKASSLEDQHQDTFRQVMDFLSEANKHNGRGASDAEILKTFQATTGSVKNLEDELKKIQQQLASNHNQ